MNTLKLLTLLLIGAALGYSMSLLLPVLFVTWLETGKDIPHRCDAGNETPPIPHTYKLSAQQIIDEILAERGLDE